MPHSNKPPAPLLAWVPLGLASMLSLLLSKTPAIYFSVLLLIGPILAFISLVLGIVLLRKHGARPLYVIVVALMLVIGQIRMLQVGLLMLALSVNGFGH